MPVLGEAEHTWLGLDLAGPGDVDGDGPDDLLVSANNDAAILGYEVGTAWFYSGPVEGLLGAPDSVATLHGVDLWCEFGQHLGPLGDLDSDGYVDLAVGHEGEEAALLYVGGGG